MCIHSYAGYCIGATGLVAYSTKNKPDTNPIAIK